MQGFFENEYSLGQVSDATGASPTLIKSWLHKKLIIGSDRIAGGEGAGHRRRFKLRSAIEIGFAKTILAYLSNRHLQIAFKAADLFAHTGADGRAQGVPFPDGYTMLGVSTEMATVVKHPFHHDEDTLMELRDNLRLPEGFILIDAGEVFRRIMDQLGLQPEDVIAEAYPEDAT